MKTILVLALLAVFTPMIFSCAENENADDDDSGEMDDDDSAADDDNSTDDDITRQYPSNKSLLPQKPMEFVGINYYHWYDPYYYDYYDINYYRFINQTWQIEYDDETYKDNEIEQFWGPNRNHVFGVGRRWFQIGSFMYQTSLFIVYENNTWAVDDNLNTLFVECYGVGGTSSENVYIIADVDVDIEPYVTSLDRYIIYHYDGQNIEEILASESGKVLRGLWIDKTGEVFAAGYQWSAEKDSYILIVHYNLKNWEELTFENIDDCIITEIWGSSPTDMYLGGYNVSDPTGYPCAVHYDGKKVDRLVFPETDPMPDLVKSIQGTGPDEIYFALSGRGLTGKIYLYDGEKFVDTNYPLKLGDYTHYGLEDMWVSSTGDVYVAGPYKGVMHYDGETWKRIPGPYLWKIYGFADQGTAGDMIGEEE